MDERQYHQRVKELFLAAVELAPGQRDAYLAEACGDDSRLRGEVLCYLEMDEEESEEIIDRPAVERFNLLDATGEGPTDTPPERSPERRRPSRISDYTIREAIAEGRSEDVYLAEQDGPERRRVEIRLYHLHALHSADQLRRSRFEVERQCLARITHPGVARVLETGEAEDGRPFLVSEKVDGEPITEHCDHRRLSIDQRLQLFTEVCRSVQHLHQRGLVHRNIRPQNVLVRAQEPWLSTWGTRRPAAPLTRLRGFGLWRDEGGSSPALSSIIRKERGSATPTFSAPEIHEEIHGPGNDIRSDVYSLGMLLAELLVGRTALRHPEQDGEAGSQRLVLSSRFAALDVQAATLRARSRRLDPQGMVRRLKGDLDAIVGKALDTDIEQRYGSAAELAIDVERHLRGLPLLEGTEARSSLGGLRRRLSSLSGVLVVALVIMAGLLVHSHLRARQSQARADASAREAAVLGRTSQILTNLLGSGCEVAQPAIAELCADFGEQPELEARVLLTIGRGLSAAGCYSQAERHLQRSQDLATHVLGAEHQQVREAQEALQELQRQRAQAEQGANAIDRILGRR